MSNIILIGFSGTGKTAVGREVARLLAWDFVNTWNLESCLEDCLER